MGQKTVLITGSTSGIGYAGALALGAQGWKVLGHARSIQRGEGVLATLRKAVPHGAFDFVTGDLGSLASVVELANQVGQKVTNLDALWNNAGALQTSRLASADGVELQRAVNHLAPFVLTARLLPLLKAAPEGRVVATGSMAQAFAPTPINQWFQDRPGRYQPMAVYGQTKLANLLFTQELQRRLVGSRVTAHVFHPGFVRTGFGSGGDPQKKGMFASISFLAIAPEKGADTGVYLVSDPAPAQTPGQYWVKRSVKAVRSATPEAAALLWAQSDDEVNRILGK